MRGWRPEFPIYERGTELLEGLASYVEAMSVGQTSVDLPREGYAANEVRGRCYEIGHALAVLLDAFAPMWKTAFEADDTQALDLYLAGSFSKRAGVSVANLPNRRSHILKMLQE